MEHIAAGDPVRARGVPARLEPGDERVVALGAPLEYGEQVKRRDCPACETETDNELDHADDEGAVIAVCKLCGAETGRWSRGSMPGEVP